MAIKEFSITFAGQNETVKPRFGHLFTSDPLSVVVGAGYLNPYMKAQGFSVLPSDFIFVYSSSTASSSNHQIYKPVFGVDGTVTLTVLP